MPKTQVSLTIDRTIVKKVDAFEEERFPGTSRSFVVEYILREFFKVKRTDASVAH